jgi:cytochrome c553
LEKYPALYRIALATGHKRASHCPGVARAATPVLDGLPEAYLRLQLNAFRSGRRANDINRQMRNAAHQLTESEVEILARYYASR